MGFIPPSPSRRARCVYCGVMLHATAGLCANCGAPVYITRRMMIRRLKRRPETATDYDHPVPAYKEMMR
jgi:hypothetical protein